MGGLTSKFKSELRTDQPRLVKNILMHCLKDITLIFSFPHSYLLFQKLFVPQNNNNSFVCVLSDISYAR